MNGQENGRPGSVEQPGSEDLPDTIVPDDDPLPDPDQPVRERDPSPDETEIPPE